MTEKLRLQDRVIIITGGAKGIGRAYALGMADEGAKLVVADINLEVAEDTAREIQGKGREALAIKTDVSLNEDTQVMASKAIERFGKIDVLVNNAAMLERNKITRAPFWELELSDWDKVMNVNLKGTFLCCRAVFPYMKTQGEGKIINTTSPVIFFGSMNQLHYAASKGGVFVLTRALARELGDYNINVNCIAPGSTQSWEPSDKESFEQRQNILQQMAPKRCFKRVELPNDLVGTAIFLASSDSDFITGQTIVVDGGEVMH
jgi:3-oxoacyl-[acyl-carrier protein] reductase